MSTALSLYDNTRLSAFKTCPRMFYWRHVRHLVPETSRSALVFGSSWHAAMDAIWPLLCQGDGQKLTDQDITNKGYEAFVAKWVEEGFPHPDYFQGMKPKSEEAKKWDLRNPLIALEMLYEYVYARRSICSRMALLEVEKPFAVPLHPDHPNLYYVGRLDKVVEFEGRIYVIEHKTTSAYSVDRGLRPSYVNSFSPNSQVDGYLFAAHSIWGKRVKAVWIDASLVHKTVHDVFKFIPIERQFEHLDAWLWETLYWKGQVEANRTNLPPLGSNEAYLSAFPKNTGSCFQFGSDCTYIDMCKMVANPQAKPADWTPEYFRIEPWEPFKELHLEKLKLGEGDAGSVVSA